MCPAIAALSRDNIGNKGSTDLMSTVSASLKMMMSASSLSNMNRQSAVPCKP